MQVRKFLKFRYTAIRRYGEKEWTAKNGVIEFNPNYTVSASTCEKISSDRDSAYIVELSNGTKFLCFMRGAFGIAQVEEILSERGETANVESDQQTNVERTRRNLYLLK